MSAADVVIHPGAGSRPARIADVIGPPPQDPESTVMAQVTWRDDDRTQVVSTRSPMVRTREGSIAFHLAVDPTAVRERYAEKPERVLAALLAGGPPTGQAAAVSLLREKLRVAPERAVVRRAFDDIATWPGVRRTGQGLTTQLVVQPRWEDPFADEPDLPAVEDEAPDLPAQGGDDRAAEVGGEPSSSRATALTPSQQLEQLGKQQGVGLVEVAKAVTTIFHASDDVETAKAVTWVAAWKRRRELSLDLLLAAVPRTGTGTGTGTGTQEKSKQQRSRSALLDTVVEKIDREGVDPTSSQLELLRDVLSREPYAAGSARRRLLVTLASRRSADLDDLAWWSGLTLADVDDLARETAGRAVRSSPVVDATARPLVEGAVANARTRTQLATLVGLAPALAELVPPSALAQAMARVASTDAVMSTWYPVVTRAAEREAALADVARWRDTAGSAEQRAQDAAALAAETEQRLGRLQALLRESQEQTIDATDAERRQAAVDATRAAVQLVLAVEDASETQPRDQLVSELVTRLATLDVVPLHRRGGRAVFDPHLHEAVGGVPEPGASVEVIRTGYSWRSGGEDVVLVKCLTTTAM